MAEKRCRDFLELRSVIQKLERTNGSQAESMARCHDDMIRARIRSMVSQLGEVGMVSSTLLLQSLAVHLGVEGNGSRRKEHLRCSPSAAVLQEEQRRAHRAYGPTATVLMATASDSVGDISFKISITRISTRMLL